MKKETVQFNDTLIDPWHGQYWPTLPAPIDKCYLGSADISLLCSSALIIHLLRIFHSFNCVSDRLLRGSAQTFESVLDTISEVLRKIKVTILRSLCRTWHEFRNYARVRDFFNHLLRPKWEDLKFSSNLARTSRLALFIMRITLWQIYWPYVRLLFNSINIRQRTLCVSHGLVDSEARQW